MGKEVPKRAQQIQALQVFMDENGLARKYPQREPVNPLLQVDSYKTALDKVTELRQKLEATADPKEASLILDEMTRAIFEARRALWEKRHKSDGTSEDR
jgi:hypothetical protein